MDQIRLRTFEAGCVQEEAPPCQTTCPLRVDARGFAALMKRGKTADARRLLDRTMPLSPILGRLCTGPCVVNCRLAEIRDGQGLDLPLLERACLALTNVTKPMPLPSTGKKTAVIGSGLSGLVAAYELAKKGHKVTVFHNPEGAGANLRRLSESILPAQAMKDGLALLSGLKTIFEPLAADDITQTWLEGQLALFDAVYICQDDPLANGLGCENGDLSINDVTRQTAMELVFAGGFGLSAESALPDGAIELAFQGKLAAGSMGRIMQGVNPGTARENELPAPSRLYTNIDMVPSSKQTTPADFYAPSIDEAVLEAGRCLECQCLECVKNCAFLRSFKGYPKKYAREMYNNLAVVQGHRQANLMINSCAQCGLCAQICPNDTNMGAFAADVRGELVASRLMPPSAHEFALMDMLFSCRPDVAFFRHQRGYEQSKWLFFPGCQLPASLAGETARVYEYLAANLDGGVGMHMACCGAPARWAGQDRLADSVAASIRQTWESAGQPTIIPACASCLAFFRDRLADLPVTTLWEKLADLPLPPPCSAAPDQIPFELALHDPCAARNEQTARTGVRAVLAGIGQPFEELELGRERTRCCGYGGLVWAANPDLGDAFARDRAEDTEKTLLSWCAVCRDRLRHVGKPSVHLLDLLFPEKTAMPRSDYLQKASERPSPGISDRQENRLRFRQQILENVWNETPPRNTHMDDIILNIPEEMAEKMEKRRILRSDVAQVLSHPEATRFCKPDDGRFLACLRPRQVTFWVEYSKSEERGGKDEYLIHDAYCHRMIVPGVADLPCPANDADEEIKTGECCKDVTGCCTRSGPGAKGVAKMQGRRGD